MTGRDPMPLPVHHNGLVKIVTLGQYRILFISFLGGYNTRPCTGDTVVT